MGQAVTFEPTDSAVFMLNTIANNIAQRNATLQNVSISVSGFTNRPISPFSQACFNPFILFKTFTFDSFVFPSRNFWRQKHVARVKQNRSNDAASLCHVSSYRSNNMNIFEFRVTGHDVVTPAP